MTRFATLLGFIVLSTAGFAQSPFYPDFSVTAGLTLNGSAAQNINVLELTPAANALVGSAMFNTPQVVVAGFDTFFDFRMVNGGADGMTFMIHNNPAGAATIGAFTGGELGYGGGVGNAGLTNCLVIEIDTYLNPGQGDPAGPDHISVHTNGTGANSTNESFSIGLATGVINLNDGLAHTLRVEYVPGTLNVYLDILTVPLISIPYDIVAGGVFVNSGNVVGGLSLIGGGSAYVGFTGATGGLNQTHEVLNWSWTSTSPFPPCWAGTVLDAAGMPEDVLMINGSTGGVFRTETITVNDPFTVSVLNPSLAPGPSGYLIFGLIGVPALTDLYPSPYGDFCFPPYLVAPLPWLFTFTNSFGPNPPGLFFSLPAPWTIPIPQATPFPLTITLQGLIVSGAAGASLSTTNSIVLDITPDAPPVISGISPEAPGIGQLVTISGVDFDLGATVALNGAPIAPTSITTSSISFLAPPNLACDAVVTVTNPDGQSSTVGLNPTPVISTTALGTGPSAGGANFVMVGMFPSSGTLTIDFGGIPSGSINIWTGTAISVITPVGPPATTVTVTVTTGTGCTATTTYTYL